MPFRSKIDKGLANENGSHTAGLIDELPISRVKPVMAALRRSTTDISQLVASIKEKGLLHPIVVRPKDDCFEIIAGSRRYAACRSLGWRKILCHIVNVDDRGAFEVSLVENLQRKTMHPLEEAKAFEAYVDEFGWGSTLDLSRRIGKSSSYVSKRISLLDLPSDVLDMIKTKEITPSIAEELLRLDDKDEQSELARLISTRHMTLRKTRNLIDAGGNPDDAGSLQSIHRDTTPCEGAFDKMIIALKLALSRMAPIIDGINDNWIVYDILMYHKNSLDKQIDLLMKERKVLNRLE